MASTFPYLYVPYLRTMAYRDSITLINNVRLDHTIRCAWHHLAESLAVQTRPHLEKPLLEA